MTTFNTASDASNTAIRAFLTQLGSFYNDGNVFNTNSGEAKRIWREICEEIFEGKCAYCGAKLEKPTIEHLVMFNKEHCGLHHPGNIVPCCRSCNKRDRDEDSRYVDWETQLSIIIAHNNHNHSEFQTRKRRIREHIKSYNYPNLTSDELTVIRALADSIYKAIKMELDKGLETFKEIDRTLIKGRSSQNS